MEALETRILSVAKDLGLAFEAEAVWQVGLELSEQGGRAVPALELMLVTAQAPGRERLRKMSGRLEQELGGPLAVGWCTPEEFLQSSQAPGRKAFVAKSRGWCLYSKDPAPGL